MSRIESSFTIGPGGGDADLDLRTLPLGEEGKKTVSSDWDGDNSRSFFDFRGVPGTEVRVRLPGEFDSALG